LSILGYSKLDSKPVNNRDFDFKVDNAAEKYIKAVLIS